MGRGMTEVTIPEGGNDGDIVVTAGKTFRCNGQGWDLIDTIPATGTAKGRLNFEAIAHIRYPLEKSGGLALLGARGEQFSAGDHFLLTNQDDGDDNGWWKAVQEEDHVDLERQAYPDPYDGSHNGDILWAYRRYDDDQETGQGPYTYGIYASSDVGCSLVTLASPVDEGSKLAANAILRVPSLTPEEGDMITSMWRRPDMPENGEHDPPLPTGWDSLGGWEWTTVHQSNDEQRVLLMLPGDVMPTIYAKVTPTRFIPIDVPGGSQITVGCVGSAFAPNPTPWVGTNSQSWFTEATGSGASATAFVPMNMTDDEIYPTGPDGGAGFTGLFSGMLGQSLRHYLARLDEFQTGVVQINSNTSVDMKAKVYEVDCSEGNVEIQLPSLYTVLGRTVRFVSLGSSEITLNFPDGELVWRIYDNGTNEFGAGADVALNVKAMGEVTASATLWVLRGPLD
eukprot:GHVR01144496.1.p1 GENE.GHVR01144496.1~~GHVR01144496.1.p1  ORF type:complete len:452 (+),score=62.08 GHVR01144496.1:860-2215(+)